MRFEREPTPEQRAARKRAEQEKLLWRMAGEQFEKLSGVGHELGDWQPDEDLQLKNTCRRCDGSVTVSVGEICLIGHIPPMQTDVCLADYPEQMAAAQREWDRQLSSVYRVLLSAVARRRKRREAASKIDESA